MSTVATVSLNSHLLNAIKPPFPFQQRYISNFNRHLIYFVKKKLLKMKEYCMGWIPVHGTNTEPNSCFKNTDTNNGISLSLRPFHTFRMIFKKRYQTS